MSTALPGANWRVHAIHLDTVHYPDWHPRAGEDGPVYVYVLQREGQTWLVDTGIGPEHPLIDRLYEPKRKDLRATLSKNRLDPDALDGIIISHLHFDHVGGAQAFPGVPLFVQRTEWEAAQAPKYTVREFLTFEGADFRMLDGDTELAPGLRVAVTAGHTPGHQVVVVSAIEGILVGTEGDEQRFGGLVVLAGQAVETTGALNEMLESGTLAAQAQQIMGLEPWRVYFSHDTAWWERDEV